MIETAMESDLARILVNADAIDKRLDELGETITNHYQSNGVEELTLICITNGSIIFAADLLRRINMYARVDCVRVSSYQNEDSPITEPEIIDQIRLDLTGRHVLLVDDILDTGKTLEKLVMILQTFEPQTLETCVLLEKQGRRQCRYEATYVGFKIPNEFVVGYGLDFAERYRNLPHIGVLRPELQNPPEWQ
ncbi:hypoxanthine phosphoribosyltransferase [Rubellicoccus peritrichatus]|uniref:Hypoxanthine phosphoribosyltransferase n=1 Tax=Rubellicoccus peritrichatus TaxID=3080537 RepID=A0AAQ3LB90_9BACT|nr:hypoxanthine phosphoribosyltransferase [Puniceicoccus sp. CR14]WOO41107.1 hypoxanthine phosphoribosyltransferase [Puniceicoccus sp. CR14]